MNGYPPGFKQSQPRKFAAVCTTYEDSSDLNQQAINSKGDFQTKIPNITVEQYNQLMNLLAHNTINKHDNSSWNALLAGTCLFLANHFNNWIIDSGASDHICSSLDFFHTYKTLDDKDSYITIPNGTRIKVTHKENVKLHNSIDLIDVLYDPTFRFNLISVHKLCATNAYSIHFTSKICTIQEHSISQPKILGKMFQGLYFADGNLFQATVNLSDVPCQSVASAFVSSRIDEGKLLHLHL